MPGLVQPPAADSPKMQPLSHLDACHVYAVLKLALLNLQLVGALPVDTQGFEAVVGSLRASPPVLGVASFGEGATQAQAAALTCSVGADVSRLLEGQRELEREFQALMDERRALRGNPSRKRLEENQARIGEVSQQIKARTQQLCRSLKENPNVAENAAKVAAARLGLEALLEGALADLAKHRALPSLQDAVQDDERRQTEMRETLERERAASLALTGLRQALEQERKAHDAEMAAQRKVLEGQQAELRAAKLAAAEKLRFRQLELNAAARSAERQEAETLEDAAELATTLKRRIELDALGHQAVVEHLERLLRAKQAEALSWGHRLEQDLAAEEAQQKQLEDQHMRNQVDLEETTAKCEEEARLKAEYTEADKAATAAEDAAVHEPLRRAAAAAKIQAAWRGFCVRRGLRQGVPQGARAGERPGSSRPGSRKKSR